MSNETMQALWNVAKAFVEDTTKLGELRTALAAHDAAEAQEPAEAEGVPEPSEPAAEAQEPAQEHTEASASEPVPPADDATDPAPNAQ